MDTSNNSGNSKSKKSMPVAKMVMCGLFAALLCVAAYISIPLPLPGAPHLTMINFVVILIALVFAPLESTAIVAVWLILGTVGLPVFIGGKGGFAYLIQPWGAYTWGFMFAAILLPFIRGKKYNRIRYTICALAGVILIDLVGMFYLMAMSGYGIIEGFTLGFLPFIPLDIVKAVIAAQIVPAFNRIMNRYGR